jgi:hypothetical protein
VPSSATRPSERPQSSAPPDVAVPTAIATPEPSFPTRPTVEPSDGPPDPQLVATAPNLELRCAPDGDTCWLSTIEPPHDEDWVAAFEGPCHDLISPAGISFVLCTPSDETVIHATDDRGREMAGWPFLVDRRPVRVTWNDGGVSCGSWLPALVGLPEGAVALSVAGAERAEVLIIESDGRRRAGWPQPIPGDRDGCTGFSVNERAETIVAWGYENVRDDSILLEADRTVITSYGFDGRRRSGWPVGSTGAASGPVLHRDGGIAYVSQTGKVWAHGPDGEVRAGWPYVIADLDADSERVGPPAGSPDGYVAVIHESFVVDGSDHRLHVIRPDGRPAGDPHRVRRVETLCLYGDTPCSGDVAAVFHPKSNVVYVALAPVGWDGVTSDPGGSILAVGPDGGIVDGWPVPLGARVHALTLSLALDGQLIVDAVRCSRDGCGEGYEENEQLTIVIEPDGSVH